MVILLLAQRLADAQFVQHGFVRVALAVLLQNGSCRAVSAGICCSSGRSFVCREFAVVIHGRIDRQAVTAAEIVVVQTVAGRDVDEARARVVRHEIDRPRNLPVRLHERMLILQPGELRAVGERMIW